MGRVRKYKKFKACDPFAKGGGASVDLSKYDEPPEVFEQKVNKIKKRRDNLFDNNELFLQREALRAMRSDDVKIQSKEKTLEPKREDESMKEFKQRIRQETRLTLNKELPKMNATAKRRKEKFKEIKTKRKLKKKGSDNYQQEVMEFNSSEEGRIRPSDYGDPTMAEFPKLEKLKFGERAERPPDLSGFKNKLEKEKLKMQMKNSALNGNIVNVDSEESDDELPKKKRKRNNVKITDRADMLGDDGLETKSSYKYSNNQSNSSSMFGILPEKKKDSIVLGTKNAEEMDQLRVKVQEAYKALREKRRANQISR